MTARTWVGKPPWNPYARRIKVHARITTNYLCDYCDAVMDAPNRLCGKCNTNFNNSMTSAWTSNIKSVMATTNSNTLSIKLWTQK